MTSFLEWSDIISQYKLTSVEILHYLIKGLQPYRQNGQKYPCPTKYNQAYIRIANLNEIHKIVVDVDYLLSETECLVMSFINKTLDKRKSGQILIYQTYNDQYHKIFNTIGKIKTLIETEAEDNVILKFFKKSNVDFDYQPSLLKLYSHSSKKIAKIHLTHIQGIQFIYKNCAAQKIEAEKKLTSIINNGVENVDWSSWNNFEIPLSDNLFDDLINILKNKIFKVDDFKKLKPELKKESKTSYHTDKRINHENINKDIQETPQRVIEQEDKGWRIHFDGENTRLDNPKAVKYISVALKNPGKELTYSQIVETVERTYQTHDVDKNYNNMAKKKGDEQSRLVAEESLFIKTKNDMNSIGEHSKNETIKFFAEVKNKYLYSDDPGEKADLIDYFKSEYKYEVYEKDDTIKMGKKIKPNQAENNRKTVQNARIAIMKKLKTSLPSLYKYFDLYLKVDNSLIYSPPEDDPPWEIIDK